MPSAAAPPSVCVSTAASIQAPPAAGTTRTTTRCRFGGHASPGGSTQADSMTPSRGGSDRKLGGRDWTMGHPAATVSSVRSQRLPPSAAGRNTPPGTLPSGGSSPRTPPAMTAPTTTSACAMPARHAIAYRRGVATGRQGSEAMGAGLLHATTPAATRFLSIQDFRWSERRPGGIGSCFHSRAACRRQTFKLRRRCLNNRDCPGCKHGPMFAPR